MKISAAILFMLTLFQPVLPPGTSGGIDFSDPSISDEREFTEAEKIEKLIASIRDLDAVVFIRNGNEHTPGEAARHMQTKLRRARRHVKSAEDFIRICATQSSLTGRKYLIRYQDGTTIESGQFLQNRLSEMEGS